MKQKYKKKTQNVYETVNNIDHKLITLRLVHNEKYVSSKLNVKTDQLPKDFKKMFKIYYKTHKLAIKKESVYCFKYYRLNKMALLVYRCKNVIFAKQGLSQTT